MIKELTIDYSQYCSVLSPTELISVSMVQAQLVAIKSEIEELKSQIKELREQNQLLLNENLALKERIAKLSKTSSNSSKPPSSDLTKKKPKKKGQGKLGGQQGHPKHERLPFSKDEVDCFHPYKLNCCPDCNGQVIITCGPPRIIQQFEIVESPLVRHEHQSFPAWCETCQKLHYKSFPKEVLKEGLVKTQLTALIAYMKSVCHASFSTIRKFIRDVLGEKISRGQLGKIIAKVSDSLEAPYQELLDRLPLESTVNVDETGHKENGSKFRTWVFKAELYVLFKIDKSRGSKVLIDVLGKEFSGVLGADYFSAYRKYMKDFNINLQFCLAHLIRDIRYLCTFPDPETRTYGQRLLQGVRNLFKVIHSREENCEEAFRLALLEAKQRLINAALENVPTQLDANGKELKLGPENMAGRFRKHGEAYFQFITTPGIDPTNNIAEQAIRFVVIDRHITQGTRSSKGRKTNERLWTVIATCALQGRSAYQFILKAVKAFFQNLPSPSLLPGET